MAARDKLQEARFFYNKIIDDACEEPDVGYYFSAFICACNSIPDYVLEEANTHFGLSIPDNSRSIRSKFQAIVKSTDKLELKKFHIFWNELKRDLEENPIVQYRHLNIHRRQVEVARGQYFSFGSDDIDGEMVEKYKRFLSDDEWWAPSRYFDLAQYADDIESIDDVCDLDPHLRDDTEILRKVCKTKCHDTEVFLYTSFFLKDETDTTDPLSISCFKMLALLQNSIDRF